ncbi:hypothetical protein JCM19238_1028 [Vibrio ponticus]|nr:hypothetical protein JCM19238_1028 [Vibrio ponticus]
MKPQIKYGTILSKDQKSDITIGFVLLLKSRWIYFAKSTPT